MTNTKTKTKTNLLEELTTLSMFDAALDRLASHADIVALVAVVSATKGVAGAPIPTTVIAGRLNKNAGTVRAQLVRLADANLINREAVITESGTARIVYTTKWTVG